MCRDYEAIYVSDLLDYLDLINPYSAEMGAKVSLLLRLSKLHDNVNNWT